MKFYKLNILLSTQVKKFEHNDQRTKWRWLIIYSTKRLDLHNHLFWCVSL